MNSQEQRIQKRVSFIEQKLEAGKKYAQHKEKVGKCCKNVRSALDFLLHHETEIEEDILRYQGGKVFFERLQKSGNKDVIGMLIKEEESRKERILAGFMYATLPANIRRRARKDLLNEMKREYIKIENKLKSYVVPLQAAVQDLIRVMQVPAHAGIVLESRDPFVKNLENLLETAERKEYENLRELVQEIRSSLKNEYIARAKAFQEALQMTNPSFKEAMLNTAQSNISSLEEEWKMRKEQKKAYLASPEGILLAFATYHIESRKVEEHEKTYKEFLLRKTEEKFAELQHFGKDISVHLKQLTEKGHLTESEAILLQSILNKESESSGAEKESFEDIQLRALLISDLGISYEESIRIARLAKDADIDRTSSELSRAVGQNLATLLLNNNPELFLMNEEQLGKYMLRFHQIVEISGRYNIIDDFNPQKNPRNFSSFDALKETKRKLYQIVQQAVSEPIIDPADSARSEIEGIKLLLAQEGFNSERAWTILQRGFYFGGQYFVGDHRIPVEHLEKNIARGASIKNIDKKEYRRELKKMLSQDALLFKLGGYSINPHARDIASEALKMAVSYILSHHPLENERREPQSS